MSARIWGWAMALGLLWAIGCGGGGGAPVRNPAPLAAGQSLDATEQAILDALPKRSWTAEDVKPGRIVAFLPVRQFLLRVEITYDQQQVHIAYVNSDNLGAQERRGQVYAHKNVNKWMATLAKDLNRALASHEPPTSGGATVKVTTNGPGGSSASTSGDAAQAPSNEPAPAASPQ